MSGAFLKSSINGVGGEPEEALSADDARIGTLLSTHHIPLKTSCSSLPAAVRRNGLHAVPTEVQFLAGTEE